MGDQMEYQNGVRSRNKETSKNEKDSTLSERKKKYYYGGPLGALLFITLAPFLLLHINSLCNQDKCEFFSWPGLSTNIYDYFHWINPVLFLFIAFVGILHSLPIGSVVDGQPAPDGKVISYRLNGIYIVVLGLFTVAVLFSVNFPLDIFYKNLTPLIVFMTIKSFLLSLHLYLKSFNSSKSSLNIYGTTGNVIYDFFMGRETNPFIGIFNVKEFVAHLSVTLWALLDISIISVQAGKNGFATPTLLLSAFGHALLILDYLIFEEAHLTSFTVNHQGTGFLFVFSNLIALPVLRICNVRVVLEKSYVIESELFTVFLFGFVVASHILYRFSQADKSLFLRYPDHAEVSEYDSIPADNGKLILSDGWWAIVRHPNYIAEILAALSWCITTGLDDFLPYTYVVVLAMALLYRINIVEDSCKQEFGNEAWNTYCQRVPYKLIKYIY